MRNCRQPHQMFHNPPDDRFQVDVHSLQDMMRFRHKQNNHESRQKATRILNLRELKTLVERN